MAASPDVLLVIRDSAGSHPLPQHVLELDGFEIVAEAPGNGGVLSEITAAVVVVNLPDAPANWLNVIAAIRDRQSRAPTLVLGGADTPSEARDRVLELPDVDFLAAPITPAALRSKLKQLVALSHSRRAAVGADGIAGDLERLKESERQFREIFETANEGIWVLNAGSRIDLVNVRMGGLLGYSVAEMVGRLHTEFVFDEDRAYMEQLFEERRAGYTASIDLRFRHRAGHAVWMLLSARPIYREGHFAGALDMFTDITARRAAEEKFRVFFELSASGHALVDPSTKRFLHVNERWCQMLGRSREQLLGKSFVDITHPEDRASDERRFADLYAGRISEIVTEKRYVRSDGSVFWGQLTSSVVRNRDGIPELQLSVVQDITARKQAEADLIDSRTRLRLAIEAADLGVVFHDGASRRSLWNDDVHRLLGLPPQVAPSFEALLTPVHPDDRHSVEDQFARAMQVPGEECEFSLEFKVLWADGSIHYLAARGVSLPRTTAEGAPTFHLIATLRDVTATKEFEMELRNKVAQRTGELEEKTHQLESFCYTIAHDLRAPLRSINGYADLIIDELAGTPNDAVLERLERIKASTRRLDSLIRDLLAYSRVSQVDVSLNSVDLHSLIDTALRELEPEIRRRDTKVTIAPELPPVLAERSILEQVIVNLLSNAIKFIPQDRRPEVEVSATVRDGRVRVEVRDNGIGIAPEYQERIFKVFERLQSSREYPGTGIGLAIVAKGLERVGGRFGVASEPGVGSTFWFELKRAETPAAPLPQYR